MKRFVILVLVLFSVQLQAEDVNALFLKANKAYQAGNYTEAIGLYEQIATQNKHSAAFYFNLGNAYYKNNELGKSILNYERGLLLKPRFKDLRYNLDLANNQLKDNIVPVKPFVVATVWKGAYNLMQPIVWGILGVILLLLSVGGVGIWLLNKDRQQKKRGFYSAIAMAFLGFLFLILGYNRDIAIHQNQDAVIIEAVIDLKDGADEDSNTIQTLHSGTKIRLIEIIGDWQKVRLSNGEVGWVLLKGIEKI